MVIVEQLFCLFLRVVISKLVLIDGEVVLGEPFLELRDHLCLFNDTVAHLCLVVL